MGRPTVNLYCFFLSKETSLLIFIPVFHGVTENRYFERFGNTVLINTGWLVGGHPVYPVRAHSFLGLPEDILLDLWFLDYFLLLRFTF